MPNLLIIGAQWGDEGKGKVVDYYSQFADLVVRFQGGNNAGHTLVVDGKTTILHLLPSGVLYDGKVCVIGNGCVLDLEVLEREIRALEAKGFSLGPDRLRIADNANIIFPYHSAIDQARETKRGEGKIGTTGRGIGPCYEDKVSRRGIRMGDLLDSTILRRKIEAAIAEKNLYLKAVLESDVSFNVDALMETYTRFGDWLRPFITDTSVLLSEAQENRKNILFEGAQGTMLDIDHGTYPFVTSSNTVAGGACAGAGVGPRFIDQIFGIAKAYTTRVGSGPFPTELEDETGQLLRKVGKEFGATTGRPRRCGWLDAVVLRASARLNSLSGLVLTKMDVLSGLDTLKICVAYEMNGQRVQHLPNGADALAKCKPIYEEIPGWKQPIDEVRKYAELPEAAKAYARKIEELVGVPIVMLSVGAGRQDTLILQNPFY